MKKIKSFIIKIKENKYLKLLSFLIVWILIILVGRMSYAFLSDEMNDSQGRVDVSAGEVDKLSFTNGTPLTLPKFNVKTFTTNQTGETSGTATLTAGEDSIYAPVTYHAYLDISTNTFGYSISDGTPELLLTVTGPDGEITSLPGLNYITIGNVSGFDITKRKNKITLTPNDVGQNISITSSSPSTIQTWTVKLTFLKQNGDQSANAGKEFSANLILQQDRFYDAFFTPLPDGNASPNKVTCQNGTVEYDDKYKSVVLSQINKKTYCTLSYEEPTNKEYLNTKISSLVGNGQVFNENGYRYEGKSPDNYIWFNNELWRIIGVFDTNIPEVGNKQLVKIIRNESIGVLSGDKIKSSLKDYCYGSSSIPTNCDYREIGIKAEYREMIETVTWYLGGPDGNGYPANQFYVDERDSTKKYSGNEPTWNGKIGLMYASDYGYSVTNTCDRTTNLSRYGNSNCSGQSWLYGQGNEWTITHISSCSYSVFNVNRVGDVLSSIALNGYAVRPVLYLKSNVRTIGGDGSLENPYIIELGNTTP